MTAVATRPTYCPSETKRWLRSPAEQKTLNESVSKTIKLWQEKNQASREQKLPRMEYFTYPVRDKIDDYKMDCIPEPLLYAFLINHFKPFHQLSLEDLQTHIAQYSENQKYNPNKYPDSKFSAPLRQETERFITLHLHLKVPELFQALLLHLQAQFNHRWLNGNQVTISKADLEEEIFKGGRHIKAYTAKEAQNQEQKAEPFTEQVADAVDKLLSKTFHLQRQHSLDIASRLFAEKEWTVPLKSIKNYVPRKVTTL